MGGLIHRENAKGAKTRKVETQKPRKEPDVLSVSFWFSDFLYFPFPFFALFAVSRFRD